MVWTVVIALVVVALLGVIAKYVVPVLAPGFASDYDWNISLREVVAGVLLASVVVTPAVLIIGSSMSVASQLEYQEFYNGVETRAYPRIEKCRRGARGSDASSGHSNCDHEYDTGESYPYEEPYPDTCTDGMGSPYPCTKYRTEWASIYAPYAKKERRYFITDSLGGEYKFPKVYVAPGDVHSGLRLPSNVPTGQPTEWVKAKQRIDAGNPRPVTRLFSYDNYILAAQDDLLIKYSKDVERYRKAKLLPAHTANINSRPLHGFNQSYADKVSFVGVKVANEPAWQKSVMGFNAALGSKLHGDLHMVVIDAAKVDSPTNYLAALKAYWLDTKYFGRRAIAKNAIIVVVGANASGDKVEWGIASTGMPFGNEVMLQGIQTFLPGTALTPEAIIGTPRTVVTPATSKGKADKVQVTLGDTPSVLEQMILRDYPFKRACMGCADDEGQIGYDDLVAEIEPSAGQYAVMVCAIAVLALFYWVFAGFTALLDPRRYIPSKFNYSRRY